MSAKVLFFALAGAWLAAMGSLYSYPLWTSRLQHRFNLTQSDTGALGTTMYSVQVSSVVVPFAFSFSRISLPIQLAASVLLPGAVGWTLLALASSGLLATGFLYFGVALLGCASGSLYIPVVGLSMKLSSRALFVSAFYACMYGLGGSTASLVLIWVSSLFWFFLGLACIHVVAGVVAVVAFWRVPPIPQKAAGDGEKRALIQSVDEEEPQPPSLKATCVAFFSSILSYLVIAVMLLNLGVGSTFAANMERYADDASLLPVLFNVVQTAGRIIAVVVGSLGEYTLQVVVAVSVLYVIVLAVGSNVSGHGQFWISLAFGLAYGGMRATIGSVLFYSKVQNRKLFLYLALFSFPLAGTGPIAFNFAFGALYDHLGSFHWPLAFLACLSGASVCISVLLWKLQP